MRTFAYYKLLMLCFNPSYFIRAVHNHKSARFKYIKKIKKELYKIDKEFTQIKLSEKAQNWFNELSSNGIVKIENEFNWVKDYFNENYLNSLDNSYFLNDLLNDYFIKTGKSLFKTVSIGDPRLDSWYFNEDIFSVLAKSFGQQPYYRNQPLLQTHTFKEGSFEHVSGKWHIDGGLKQISLMLLLNTISTKDTHMKYALKSHIDHNLFDFNNLFSKKIESNYEIMDCVGEAGTLFIFNGGKGYHKAFYKKGTIRSIYHANFTPGNDVKDGFEKTSLLPKLTSKPFFIQLCADKIVN